MYKMIKLYVQLDNKTKTCRGIASQQVFTKN